MKRSRYFLKRTKFALLTGFLPLLLGILLILLSIMLISFNLWANSLTIETSLLPMATNLPIFYDIDGNEMEYKSDNFLRPDEIPTNLKNAFIALEDKRFYEHNGFDTYRIAGAMAKNLTKGTTVEGASTITQQLVKNTHLTFEKTIARKIKEIALSTKLEKMYTKDEILSMYLSVIYFGNGAYGVKSASKLYFDKDVTDLTLSECATLAGIIKSPTKYSPKNNPINAKERRNIVLSAMNEQGYISSSQMLTCANEELHIVENNSTNISQFFIYKAIEEVCQKLNLTKYQLDNSGLHIYTTYSPKIQKILIENSNLNNNFSEKDIANSSVVVDNKTGFVLAYTSSLGYEAYRQAGSTLKPFVVYAPALDKNILTLATPIDDSQTSFGDWTPKNYNDKYVGISNMRDGLKMSSNTIAVRVGSYVGENVMYEYGRRFGIDLIDADKNLTLALGATAKGQSPLTIARAYTSLSNEGRMQSTTFLRHIVDNGRKIYSNMPAGIDVITKETAYLLTDCLVDTVKAGTARSLSPLPFTIASKTGTVAKADGKNTDSWNASYNNKYTVVVWHGDADETGGGHPTKHAYNIWKSLYEHCNKNSDFVDFKTPASITKLPVDTYSTKKLNHVTIATSNTPSKYIKNEYFKKSNAINFEISLFESSPIDFDISRDSSNENIKISFFGEDAFAYKLVRKDILGERIIGEFAGCNSNIEIFDKPLFNGFQIEYELIAYPKESPIHHISGRKSKSIIF